MVGGGPGLILVVEKFPGVSTPEVTADVEEALETLRPGLTGITTDTTLFRPADYVQEALDNAGLAVLVGGVLLLAGCWRCGSTGGPWWSPWSPCRWPWPRPAWCCSCSVRD